MRPYEAMVIFEATAEPSRRFTACSTGPSTPSRAKGGNPGAIDRWGKRTFAYEVKHKREGYYVVVEFTGEPRDGGRHGPDARPGRRGGAPQGGAPARQVPVPPGRRRAEAQRTTTRAEQEQTWRQTTA